MFLQIFSHCLWFKYCHGCLIWIANGQNWHFVQKYLCFILLRGDLNICGWETDEKLTRFCWSSMDVLPSKSSSRLRDWKLSIDIEFVIDLHRDRTNQNSTNFVIKFILNLRKNIGANEITCMQQQQQQLPLLSLIIMLSVSKTEGHKMGASTEVVFIDNGTDNESNGWATQT